MWKVYAPQLDLITASFRLFKVYFIWNIEVTKNLT